MLENGTQVKDINELIRAAKNVSQKLGNPLPTNVPQNVINATQDVKRQTGVKVMQSVLSNFVKKRLDADISPNDRALINKALDVLALPLGTEPVVAAEAILEEAIGRSETLKRLRSTSSLTLSVFVFSRRSL